MFGDRISEEAARALLSKSSNDPEAHSVGFLDRLADDVRSGLGQGDVAVSRLNFEMEQLGGFNAIGVLEGAWDVSVELVGSQEDQFHDPLEASME
eukprot:1713281-Amphidinium_carterae.1